MLYQYLAGQRVTFTSEPGAKFSAALKPLGGSTSTSAHEVIEQESGIYELDLETFEVENVGPITFTFSAFGVGSIARTLFVNDPETLVDGTKYCTIKDIYQRYGQDNVNKWADLNNFQNPDQIATRIIDEIVTQSSYVDSKLRDRYYEPPYCPVPREILDITRGLAAYGLYASRKIQDEDDSDNFNTPSKKQARGMLREIVSGQIRLDLKTYKTHGSPLEDEERFDPWKFKHERYYGKKKTTTTSTPVSPNAPIKNASQAASIVDGNTTYTFGQIDGVWSVIRQVGSVQSKANEENNPDVTDLATAREQHLTLTYEEI